MTVFIQKGDEPMSYRQAVKRGLRYFESEKAYWQREQGMVEGDAAYLAWAAQWVTDNTVNEVNNLFNHNLRNYRKATARLARYVLADGRAEVYEDKPTGEYDEEGNEVTQSVLVQTAIDALEPTVEVTTYDVDGNETTETVANPLIVVDDAERAAAQSIVDGTPVEVKDWVDAQVDALFGYVL